jgi:hypothetical protein
MNKFNKTIAFAIFFSIPTTVFSGKGDVEGIIGCGTGDYSDCAITTSKGHSFTFMKQFDSVVDKSGEIHTPNYSKEYLAITKICPEGSTCKITGDFKIEKGGDGSVIKVTKVKLIKQSE